MLCAVFALVAVHDTEGTSKTGSSGQSISFWVCALHAHARIYSMNMLCALCAQAAEDRCAIKQQHVVCVWHGPFILNIRTCARRANSSARTYRIRAPFGLSLVRVCIILTLSRATHILNIRNYIYPEIARQFGRLSV